MGDLVDIAGLVLMVALVVASVAVLAWAVRAGVRNGIRDFLFSKSEDGKISDDLVRVIRQVAMDLKTVDAEQRSTLDQQ